MASHTMEDLSSSILDFQANIIRITNRKKMTMVEPGAEQGLAARLEDAGAPELVRREEQHEHSEAEQDAPRGVKDSNPHCMRIRRPAVR